MLHNELKQGEQVVFIQYCNILERDDYEMGNVIYVDEKRKVVAVSYLEGYKSRSDEFPFDKVVARYKRDGDHMYFGVIHGPSDLLEIQ